VILAPDSYGIALRGLRSVAKIGDRIALVLTVEHADGSQQDLSVIAKFESVRRSTTSDTRTRISGGARASAQLG
jgi:hypothetical protein